MEYKNCLLFRKPRDKPEINLEINQATIQCRPGSIFRIPLSLGPIEYSSLIEEYKIVDF